MAPADPMLSAVHSENALLPVVLQDAGNKRWIWDSVLPIAGGRTRFLVFSGAPSKDRASWRLTIRDPGTGMAPAPNVQVTESHPTELGLGKNTIPAELYEVQTVASVYQQVRIESDEPGRGFLLMEGGPPIRLLSYQAAFNQRVGERIGIIAAVYDADAGFNGSGLGGVSEALLRVTTPDGRVLTSDMHDDGLHRDGQRGDAVYGGEFLADRAGNFKAQALFRGQSGSGAGFVRTAEHLIPVIEGSVHLQGQAAIGTMQGDHRLRVGLEVSAPEPERHYRVYAEVWGTDPSGNEASIPVAWVGGMSTVDDDGLHVSLDTRWITKSGAREPFELRKLRVEDSDFFITLASAERMPLAIPALPATGAPPEQVVVDAEMLVGRRPSYLDTDERSTPQATARAYTSGIGHKLLLVHGYCSSDVWGPLIDQFDNAAVFLDLGENRTNDQFAQLLLDFGLPWRSYSIIAHSQGGMASLHLYNYYWSGLDNAGPGRLIQSVGTPYQGTPLATELAVIGQIFGHGCGTSTNLTPSGAASWLAGITSSSRSEVSYYTTSFTDDSGYDYCSLITDLFLEDPDDGVVERARGQLPGGVNLGHKTGWCHSAGMHDPPQTTDSARNAVMNADAAVGLPDLIVTGMAVSDTMLETGQSFTASATVQNQGGGSSTSTTLRYYRSTDSTLTTSDTELSTVPVSSLPSGGSSPESDAETIDVAGTFWIGACVDAVSGESITTNQCSTGLEVTVTASTACEGDNLVIANVTYPSGPPVVCVGNSSIAAGPAVRVESGAEVSYLSPLIRLNSGFSVETGAIFHAFSTIAALPIQYRHETLVPSDASASPGARALRYADLPAALIATLQGAGAGAGLTRDFQIDMYGRYVLFVSDVDLVPDDVNRVSDVYSYDAALGWLELVSSGIHGLAGEGASDYPAMDAAGERVVLQSEADDLVFGDDNGVSDIFLYDRAFGSLARVTDDSSRPSNHPDIDARGENILFDSVDADGFRQVFVSKGAGEPNEQISVSQAPNGQRLDNHHPAISADGRYIAYTEVAPSGETTICSVQVYERKNGLFARLPCPSAIVDDSQGRPRFSAGAERIEWYWPDRKAPVALANPLWR